MFSWLPCLLPEETNGLKVSAFFSCLLIVALLCSVALCSLQLSVNLEQRNIGGGGGGGVGVKDMGGRA